MNTVRLRPGPARVGASPRTRSKLGAKEHARARIVALWPELSMRQRCELYLFMDESTLRGQLDPRAMNRRPSDRLLELLEYYEGIARISGRLGAVG